MKKFLWLSALVLSCCLAYGQVLNSVKPLGIPLGTDKATVLKAMQDLGGVIEQQAPGGNRVMYTLKQQFAGFDFSDVFISFEEDQLALVTFALPSARLESVIQQLKPQYGEPQKMPSSGPTTYNWQLVDAETKGLAVLSAIGGDELAVEGKSYTLISFAHDALVRKQKERKMKQALKEHKE